MKYTGYTIFGVIAIILISTSGSMAIIDDDESRLKDILKNSTYQGTLPVNDPRISNRIFSFYYYLDKFGWRPLESKSLKNYPIFNIWVIGKIGSERKKLSEIIFIIADNRNGPNLLLSRFIAVIHKTLEYDGLRDKVKFCAVDNAYLKKEKPEFHYWQNIWTKNPKECSGKVTSILVRIMQRYPLGVKGAEKNANGKDVKK